MSAPTIIVYDGDCIYCQNYVRLVRLREAVGPVELVNARSLDPRVQEYRRRGYDLNEGMIFDYQGRIYHGADAVYVLGGLSSESTYFSWLNRAIFSSRTSATLLYPLLKIGRRVTLALRGKSLIK